MQPKGIITLLAGPVSIVAILVLMLLSALSHGSHHEELLAYVTLVLMMLGSYSLQRYLRGTAHPPDEQTTGSTAARPNRLAWILALCAAVFALDLSDASDTFVGIGYLLAVILTLSSNRPWHIIATTATSAVLLLLSPFLSAYQSGAWDTTWWAYVETHGVILFAIAVTGLFGSANMHKSQAEARALAEVAQSKTEASQLRQALERAEAAEAARRKMLERVQMANEAAGISIWEWRLKDNTVAFDEGTTGAQRLFGKLDRMASDSVHVHPDSLAAYRQVFVDALARPGGSESYFSHRYRFAEDLPDGTPRYVQFCARILRSPRGRPYAMLGVDWEVTQEEASKREISRQAEQLREAQARFQRAVSGTRDALFEHDFRRGTVWRSPRFAEMLGYEDGELREEADAFMRVVHPEDVGRIRAAMQRHLLQDEPYDIELRLIRKNGDTLWVRVRGKTQRNAEGEPLVLAGSISDITDSHDAREAIIRAAREAEAASRAKSTFLATMSHEIRTPMNGIIGMTGLLLDTELNRVQREYADTIRSSADSLLTILNDILDFSKIEAGKLDIEAIELDLPTHVEEVSSVMAFQAAAKGLELVVNVRPEVPTRVIGDPQRIRQCLLNLLGNAIKFTQRGEVVVDVCLLGRQEGNALVHFEVRDTGVGISADTLQKLFRPFTQADSSTTRKFGGTGLGLSIVHKLVELMGGRVGAQSEPGKGSTFWFTLPLENVHSEAAEVERTAAPSDRRVLLVDDNDTNRRVLSDQLSHAGYDVEAVASAQEALKLLRERTDIFDVVVLDYQMPDMDGAMLGDTIVRSPEIGPTRLVLLTSLDRSGDLQRFADIGFAAYLTKPVRKRELLKCLHKALARNAEEWHSHTQTIITRGTLVATDAKPRYTGKVLLVEDNAINQRVACRFLERLGCEVQIASDGMEAIEAFQRERFAFVLMDMQMPVMDGLEATRRIRELEQAGSERTPIVALTANAMMGTLERCLDAGMDDYLTKPLDISRLQDVLDRFIGAQPVSSMSDMTPADSSIRARIAEIAGEDAEFATELVETFVTAGEQALDEMRGGMRTRDADAVRRAAHKLKGASANLGLDAIATLAHALERSASDEKDGDWPPLFEQLTAEFVRIGATLRNEWTVQPPVHGG